MTGFNGVSQLTPQQALQHDILLNRHTDRFAEVLTQAQQLLLGLYPELHHGPRAGTGLLFNMNHLFEAWLGRHLAIVTQKRRLKLSTQGSGRYLGINLSRHKAQAMGLLKPDYCVTDPETQNTAMIADAKWKRLDHSRPNHGLSPADLYQMQSYAVAYRPKKMALLYPAHEEFSTAVELKLHGPQQTPLWLVPVPFGESDVHVRNFLQTHLFDELILL